VETTLIQLSSDIVASYLSHNQVRAAELPDLIRAVYKSMSALQSQPTQAEAAPAPTRKTPAEIRRSITPDALISFIDGKGYKTLKRHLATHGLTIEAYRERFGLSGDYPTTAPAYSARRSAMAKANGLGNKKSS